MLMFVVSCHSAHADLDGLCQTSKDVLADTAIATPFKIGEIEKRFSAGGHSRAAGQCVKASLGAAGVPPNVKYAVLEECARKADSAWTCPPLRDFMTAPATPVRGGP